MLLLIANLSGGITASLTATEGDDTLSSAAVLAITATSSLTESADTLTSAATLGSVGVTPVSSWEDYILRAHRHGRR